MSTDHDHVISRYADALAQARHDLSRGKVSAKDALSVRQQAQTYTTLDEKAVLLVNARHPGLIGLTLAVLLHEREHERQPVPAA